MQTPVCDARLFVEPCLGFREAGKRRGAGGREQEVADLGQARNDGGGDLGERYNVGTLSLVACGGDMVCRALRADRPPPAR